MSLVYNSNFDHSVIKSTKTPVSILAKADGAVMELLISH